MQAQLSNDLSLTRASSFAQQRNANLRAYGSLARPATDVLAVRSLLRSFRNR